MKAYANRVNEIKGNQYSNNITIEKNKEVAN